MASDSQTATTSEKPVENKVNEEAKLMEKEIVFSETADVVKDKPVSNSHVTVMKEEKIDQTPAGEPENESPAVVEEVAAVVKAEESTEKGKDEIGEKVDEQVEHQEPTFVKEVVDVIDENGEKKLAEEVELEEPILVKEGVEEVNTEAVDAEKSEEKRTMESNVSEEDNKDKEDKKKMVDVSQSTDEAIGKQVEPIDVQSVRDVSAETAQDKIKDVEVLEVEPRLEVSEKVETQPEKAKELAPEVEVLKAEETPETTEQAKVELEGKLEDKIVETEESVIKSKDEKISESGSALRHEEIVPTSQDSDTDPKKETGGDASSPNDLVEKAITEEKHEVEEPSEDEKTSESDSAFHPEKVVPTTQDSNSNPKKETEGDVSSPADVIEKAITEEKHVVEETSKDELENVSEAKDVVTKLAIEDENIQKDTEPATDGKSGESLKETDTESREEGNAANKEEESIAEKVPEVVETAQAVKGDDPKQQPEVTAKDVSVKQKHSNSIISKVKQSLVKAKKAIIGKSPSSKTFSTEEAKGEIKAKR